MRIENVEMRDTISTKERTCHRAMKSIYVIDIRIYPSTLDRDVQGMRTSTFLL